MVFAHPEVQCSTSVNRVHVHITTWIAKERCRFFVGVERERPIFNIYVRKGEVKNRIKYKTQYHLHAF